MTILCPPARPRRPCQPPQAIHAHCDLPCGVYDPAQARIEAESVKGCMEKFNASDDNVFKTRAVSHQGGARRAGQAPSLGAVDRLLQAAHLEAYPQLHELFWNGHQDGG